MSVQHLSDGKTLDALLAAESQVGSMGGVIMAMGTVVALTTMLPYVITTLGEIMDATGDDDDTGDETEKVDF